MSAASAAVIDLRSDTVTAPCDGMRAAMRAAAVGDDVYGEDPTVKKLEQELAAMTAQSAGLFFPTGTMSNLAALLTHCARGDEYIVAQTAHTYKYEGGGAAVLGGIQPQPLDAEPDGTLDLNKVAASVKADDFHFAKTKLLSLENTFHGRVLPLAYLQRAAEFARRYDLKLHLDGARVFNAAVALNIKVAEITRGFDSVSVCLSKGLGAPVGSVLCGGAEFIARARRWRKMAGGGMRQAGVLAAAGLYALQNNIARLADDHRRAANLAAKFNSISGVEVAGGSAHTNMLFVKFPGRDYEKLRAFAKARGVLLGGRDGDSYARLVIHKHITCRDVDRVAQTIADFLQTKRGA